MLPLSLVVNFTTIIYYYCTVGYGGYPAVGDDVERYDGFISRPDTWETYDGSNWRQLNWNNTFGGRAWMGIEVMHDTDPRIPYPRLNTSQPPKM